MSITTIVYFSPQNEEIIIDRSMSNSDSSIIKTTERGAHTLFTIKNGASIKQEQLTLSVYCDNHIIEVYANDRFALSTHIYSDLDANKLSFFAKGDLGCAKFVSSVRSEQTRSERSRNQTA